MRWRRVLCAAVGLVAWLGVAQPAWASPPNTPDPGTWGTDGRVWTIVQVGGTVYVGGVFSHAVAPDGSTVARSNLMAIDAATGTLVTDFAPDPNATVYALATDGSQLFVGGDFSIIAGESRSRFAAFSGGNLESWKAEATGGTSPEVRSLAVSGSTLYLGGKFKQINGAKRTRLAALDLSTQAPSVLPWHPSANANVRAIAPLGNGQVVVGGVFTSINGTAEQYIAAINADSTVGPWATHPPFQVWQVHPFGSDVLVAAGGTGDPDGHAYRFTNDGTVTWDTGTDGGVQAVDWDPVDGEVIIGGHYRHVTGISAPRLAALDPATGAVDPQWTPKPNSSKGVWALDVTADKIYAGGDFTLMGSATFMHLARFSI
jgi:hypothetical protein